MVRSQTTVEAAIQRTRRYWFVDGLGETWVGINVLVTGALLLVRALLGANASLGFNFVWLMVVLIPATAAASREVIRSVRERTTYLRTGYAAPPSPLLPLWRIFTLIGLLTMISFCAYISLFIAIALWQFWVTFNPRPHEQYVDYLSHFNAFVQAVLALGRWLPGAVGIGSAVAFVYGAIRYQIVRFYALAGFSALVGSALLISTAYGGPLAAVHVDPFYRDTGIELLLLGGALLISGLLTYRVYMRANPLPREEPA